MCGHIQHMATTQNLDPGRSNSKLYIGFECNSLHLLETWQNRLFQEMHRSPLFQGTSTTQTHLEKDRYNWWKTIISCTPCIFWLVLLMYHVHKSRSKDHNIRPSFVPTRIRRLYLAWCVLRTPFSAGLFCKLGQSDQSFHRLCRSLPLAGQEVLCGKCPPQFLQFCDVLLFLVVVLRPRDRERWWFDCERHLPLRCGRLCVQHPLCWSFTAFMVDSFFSTLLAWISLKSKALPSFRRLAKSGFSRRARRLREFEEQLRMMCSLISLSVSAQATQAVGVWGWVFFEWELMPVMVRVEKFKNLQNKACLPSLLCYLLCPGYFGGDFLNTFSPSFCFACRKL